MCPNKNLTRAILVGALLCRAVLAAVSPNGDRRPEHFSDMPGGDSFAFVHDRRPGLPEIVHPNGVKLTPVRIEPLIPDRYPEELQELAVFRSPDPEPAGIAWDGSSLWVGGRRNKKIYLVDPDSGKVRKSFPCPGRFPTGLAYDGKQMWHTDARARKLYCFKGESVVREYSLNWHCVGVAKAREGLIIGDWETDKLRLVSPQTGKIIRTMRAPDVNVFGLAADNDYLWCVRGDCLIVQDQKRELPVTGFGVAGRHPDNRRLAGVDIVGDSIWYSDSEKGRLVKIRKPEHGQRIAAKGIGRKATFWMKIHNTSTEDWEPFAFLWNVAIYEMPGQRYLNYEITPEPVAHYRDPDGNLHALFQSPRLKAGQAFHVRACAELWSADRWTFLDPREVSAEIPPKWGYICSKDYRHNQAGESSIVRTVALEASRGQVNPYWKLRTVHDALLDRVVYTRPTDESAAGVLKTGKGLCRNFSTCLQALGQTVGIPVVDAWAPHHNLVCAYLPGAGWSFIEVTANNEGEGTNRWRRSIWFGGLSRGQLTTGVRGLSIGHTVTVDGRPFVCKRHCRIPAAFGGFREQDDWEHHLLKDGDR